MLAGMAKKRRKARTGRRAVEPETLAGRVTPDADLTWLLNRAAQRLRAAMEEAAERHGIQARDYVVLTALGTLGSLTQLALGQALGLDKTTLTLQLDRLEKQGLVLRRADPHDRRARMPEATATGRAVQARVAAALSRVEASLLQGFTAGDQRSLRLMLCELIESGGNRRRVTGSCL